MIGAGYRLAGRLAGHLRRAADPLVDLVLGPGALRCPVCRRSVRRFLPLPRHYHVQLRAAGWPYSFEQAETCNAGGYSCPRCLASDRDRLCALYLDRVLIAESAPRRLVQFAPSAPLSRYIERIIAARGLTVSYRTADLYAAGVDDRVDLMDLKLYADGSLDCFVCSHVLEHVADDRKALSELCRVLRPGGAGLLLVPIVLGIDAIDEDPTLTDPHERWRRFGQDDHVRLYSKAGFLQRVRAAGFVVRELDMAYFGAENFERHGIAPRSVLYLAKRPR